MALLRTGRRAALRPGLARTGATGADLLAWLQEFDRAQAENREADGVPWPLDAVRVPEHA